MCKAKEGKRLNLKELPHHYALCLYDRGQFTSLVDPGEKNRDFEGKAVDEYGKKFRYKCQVPNCPRSLPYAKAVGFREWALHAGISHYLVEMAMENEVEKNPAMKEVLATVRQMRKAQGVLLDNMPGPSREEIHNCLLCSNKDGKNLSLDPSKLSDHYAFCLYNRGQFTSLVDPGEENRDFEGKAVDEYGSKFRYQCQVWNIL